MVPVGERRAVAGAADCQQPFTFIAAENAGKQELAKDAKSKGKLARIGDYEQQLLDEARAAGWQGKVIPLEASQVEDQNMPAWTEKMPDKSERSILSMKIRPNSEKELLKIITENVSGVAKPKAAYKIGEPVYNLRTLAKRTALGYR